MPVLDRELVPLGQFYILRTAQAGEELAFDSIFALTNWWTLTGDSKNGIETGLRFNELTEAGLRPVPVAEGDCNGEHVYAVVLSQSEIKQTTRAPFAHLRRSLLSR